MFMNRGKKIYEGKGMSTNCRFEKQNPFTHQNENKNVLQTSGTRHNEIHFTFCVMPTLQ